MDEKEESLPDTVKQHKEHAMKKISFGLVIVSTTRYREIQQSEGPTSDRTLDLVDDIIFKRGYKLARHEFIPDDPAMIENQIRFFLEDDGVDIVLTSGGTGISPKDKTIETVSGMGFSCLPGFGEIFRHLSFQEIGSAAIMSRAEAYLAGEKCIFCLPGSPKAVRLALNEIIIPEAGHLLSQLRKAE